MSRARKKLSAIGSYNARILADHAELRALILKLRPDWSAEKLAAVRFGYGTTEQPGLHDILEAIERADRMAAWFGVAP